jgi:hypothetical protein
MQIALIGDYEVTYREGGDPSLVVHQVVRGYDAVRLGAPEVAALRELLAVQQKRIRELGGYRVILGAGGDLTIYDQLGRRACYLNGDQTGQLARLVAG